MYPNLYFLVKDLFGLELSILKIVQSFGFFVAMAFAVASIIWTQEIIRKKKLGEFSPIKKKITVGQAPSINQLLSPIITGFFMGFKLGLLVTDYDGFISNPQSALLSLHGNVFIGIAFAAIAGYLKYREVKKEQLPEPIEKEEDIQPETHVGNMIMLAALFGIIGAKLFHLLENPDEFATLFNSASSFFSGLTIYGGLILGATAVLIYAKKNQLTLLHLVDAAAPSIMIAYGIGRIGCQVSGDGDWGLNNPNPQPDWLSFLPEWTWSYTYPNNVNGVGELIEGCVGPYCYELANPVWPTPLYETTVCLILFAVLWSIRKRISAPGVLFSIYLIFNGLERFSIEKIRINEHLFGTTVTQAEIISTALIIIGTTGIFYFNKKHKTAHA